MNAPDLSIVVIGRNEGARLGRCLHSVHAIEGAGEVELIYVDSGSTDESVALAASLGARVISVHPARPTAALGRNAGWKHAHAPVVFFLDGDTILNPAFVAAALPEFRDPQVAVVWGHRREIHTSESFFNRALDLDWIYPPGFTDFCGGDALVRRCVVEKIGGFDENLIAGEEPEMCRRIRAIGYKILHVDRPMTGHDLAMKSWKQYWKRASRAGYAYAEVSERFRFTPLPFWKKESRANRVRAIVLLAIPLCGVVFSVVLFSFWPAAAAFTVLFLLVLRTAAKARSKSRNSLTRLLYALHSHAQQIPIFWGQLQYIRDRRAGARRGLIEYKDAAP